MNLARLSDHLMIPFVVQNTLSYRSKFLYQHAVCQNKQVTLLFANKIELFPTNCLLLYQLSSMGSFPLPLWDCASLPPASKSFATESSKASRNDATVNLSASKITSQISESDA
jgi:hypothetical protein